MSYVDKILEPGERLLNRTHKHWIVFWPPVAVSIFGLLFLSSPTSQEASIGWLFILIGALWAFWIFLREWFEEYAVTNRRVVRKDGIIWRDVAIFPLDRVQTIDVHQSILGRLLNYGTVVLHTAATDHGTTTRTYIHRPEAWRQEVFRAIESLSTTRSRGGQRESVSAGASAAPSASDRLRELDRLFKDGLVTREEYEKKRKDMVESL